MTAKAMTTTGMRTETEAIVAVPRPSSFSGAVEGTDEDWGVCSTWEPVCCALVALDDSAVAVKSVAVAVFVAAEDKSAEELVRGESCCDTPIVVRLV